MSRVIYFYLFLLFFSSCYTNPEKKKSYTEEAESWTLSGFKKENALNPILIPSDHLTFTCAITGKEVKWEERNVLNPSAIVKNDTIFMFYRAQDTQGTSRIGLATSIDGLHFDKHPQPVFYPDQDSMQLYEWNYKKRPGKPLERNCKNCYFDGVEDPRIIETEDGSYLMTYTAYDGKKARLAIATSRDLFHWTKQGLLIKEPSFKDLWSKSGAVITELKDNRLIATKIDGLYWMYFGDTNLYLAYSKDLINWELARNKENGKMISVMHPRQGYFDSRLVEPGPLAILKNDGILLIYNGSNAANYNDQGLPRYTYAAGQALFDKNAPYKLIKRTADYFLFPEKEYEIVGEVNNVCFVEGLVLFKDKWFLYYGTGDSKIAVAVSDSKDIISNPRPNSYQ